MTKETHIRHWLLGLLLLLNISLSYGVSFSFTNIPKYSTTWILEKENSDITALNYFRNTATFQTVAIKSWYLFDFNQLIALHNAQCSTSIKYIILHALDCVSYFLKLHNTSLHNRDVDYPIFG